MNVLITEGCPGSGWETVVPILEKAGLELADGRVTEWLDELFEKGPERGAIQSCRPLQPDHRMAQRVAGLLRENANSSLMLADNRNLWLLDFWAATFPQARFLLFFRRADMALAHALTQGVDAHSFIEAWVAASRQLLQFQRRNRKRSLLLDADGAARRPDALIQAARRGGIALKDARDFSGTTEEPPLCERLLAASLIADDPAVHALHAELEASAQPLSGGSLLPPLGAEELLADYRLWQARERIQHQRLDEAVGRVQEGVQAQQQQAEALSRLRRELDQVQAQEQSLKATLAAAKHEVADLSSRAQEAQAELETSRLQFQESETLRQQLDVQQLQLRAQLNQAQQAVLATETSRNAVAQENELLLVQVGQLLEEVEQHSAKYRESVGALECRDREISALGRRLAAIQNSKLWKTTAPLRAFARIVKISPHRRQATLRRHVKLVESSALFDKEWYLAQNKDVQQAGVDPIWHYLKFGAAEGRDPYPGFDTSFYLETYPDVAQSGVNPLVHFIKFGRGEGRTPSPGSPLA